jgi:tetratricopeptide (TPR) repeat protein
MVVSMTDSAALDRRHRVLTLVVALGLGALATVTAVAALFSPPRWLSVLLVTSVLVPTMASAVLVYLEQRRRDREREADRRAAIQMALPRGLDRVRRTDPYPDLVLRTSRAVPYQRRGQPRPPYVGRDVDDPMRAAFADPGTRIVVVRGDPSVGKGRTTFEAVRWALPNHWLLAPSRFEGLATLWNRWPPQPRKGLVLLWLDDLRNFARPGGLPSDWVLQWVTHEPEVKLVALVRGNELVDGEGELYQAVRDTLARLEERPETKKFSIEAYHSDLEWAEVKRLYDGEEVQRCLGDHLVTADRHIERFKASRGQQPNEFLVVWACAVAQHLLRQRWVSLAQVAAVYQVGLNRWPFTLHLTMNDFMPGIYFATKEFRSTFVPPLQERPTRMTTWYSAPHYLVEHVVEHELRRAGLPFSRVPDEAWDALLAGAGALDAVMLGIIAYDWDDWERAERAWAKAAQTNEQIAATTARISLAVLDRERAAATDDQVQREQALQRAVEQLDVAGRSGDPYEGPRADRLLGDILVELRRFPEALDAYERAITSEHLDEGVRARWCAGVLLRDHLDDPSQAADLLADAMDSGHYDVAPRAALDLGRLLTVSREPADAERLRQAVNAFRRAIRLGDREVAAAATLELGRLHRTLGDPVSAATVLGADIFREGPFAAAAVHELVDLHLSDADLDRARRGLAALIDEQSAQLVPVDAYRVGKGLAGAGDPDRAVRAFQLAIGSGEWQVASDAGHSLEALFNRLGDLSGARSALSAVVEKSRGMDNPRILATSAQVLADFLHRHSEPERAAWVYQDAVEALGIVEPAQAGSNRFRGDELVASVIAGWRAALGQVVDRGAPDTTWLAANQLVRLHLGSDDLEGVRAVWHRLGDLPDAHLADTTKLRLVSVLEGAGELQLARSLANELTASSYVKVEAVNKVADLEIKLNPPEPDLGSTTWYPSSPTHQEPSRPTDAPHLDPGSHW